MKPYIKEVIVVEGAHDSAHLKRFFDCETIITGGLGISEKVIAQIKEAAARTGIIVFTDPDTPGKVIRRKVEEAVPDCRHAYVMKEDARTRHKVGVEHTSYAALKEALEHATVLDHERKETITSAEFYELGLMGEAGSEEKRRIIARVFHTGEGNAKYLRQILSRRGITAAEVKQALEENG